MSAPIKPGQFTPLPLIGSLEFDNITIRQDRAHGNKLEHYNVATRFENMAHVIEVDYQGNIRADWIQIGKFKLPKN